MRVWAGGVHQVAHPFQHPTLNAPQGLAHGVDEVAVKRIRAEQPSPAQIKVFRDEINCLRRLNHRNIVQVGWESCIGGYMLSSRWKGAFSASPDRCVC